MQRAGKQGLPPVQGQPSYAVREFECDWGLVTSGHIGRGDGRASLYVFATPEDARLWFDAYTPQESKPACKTVVFADAACYQPRPFPAAVWPVLQAVSGRYVVWISLIQAKLKLRRSSCSRTTCSRTRRRLPRSLQSGSRRKAHSRRNVEMEILPAGGPDATYRALAAAAHARAVVLVEGFSDQLALEALASRRGRRLDDERVAVVPVGGAQAIGRFLEMFGPRGRNVTLAGLVDAREETVFRVALERAGLGTVPDRSALERLGFFVCVEDLEDELIRAVGTAGVEAVLATHDDLDAFRTFQKQPAWRGRPPERQLRRFMGSADRRKLRYARLLVDALDLGDVPWPLDAVLDRTGRAGSRR